ncbi:hypothetical protein [Streptomyces sp. NPDC093589]|uniref:hypothetical protein n=1 Tax=Streptomyces sp. NPDC093589 TaxID=3366043 RepID=UPI003815ECC5
MGYEDSSTTRAAAGMRILQEEFTAPRARTADGAPRARAVHAPPPCDLGLLDHLQQSRRELIDTTRVMLAGHPTPQPLPPAPADEGIYQWMVESTAHLDAGRRRAQDAIVYRQGLEHALRAGDTLVIRREACPGCGCWSLMWRQQIQRAVCIQRECRDDIGRASQWELRQLAHHHIANRPQRAAK